MTFIGSSCPTSTPSGLSLLYCPGLPPSIRRVTRCVRFSVPSALGSGHRIQATPLAAPITPQISSMRGPIFGASSVRFRYGPPVCSPPELTGPAGRPCKPPGAFTSGLTRSPRMPAGYHYDAKLRIASAGLSPASTATSLAAPVRRIFPGTASSIRHLTVQHRAFRSIVEVKADPAMPPIGYCVYSALRRRHHRLIFRHCVRKRRLRSRHLSPEVLAPTGLCCPGHQRLATSSASQENSVPFPGSAGYRRAP